MVDIFDWIYVIGVCGALVYIVIKKGVTYFRYERYHRTRGQDLVDEVFMSEREWQNRKRVEQTEPKRLLGYVSCEQTDYVRFIPENINWYEPTVTTPDWWMLVGINVQNLSRTDTVVPEDILTVSVVCEGVEYPGELRRVPTCLEGGAVPHDRVEYHIRPYGLVKACNIVAQQNNFDAFTVEGFALPADPVPPMEDATVAARFILPGSRQPHGVELVLRFDGLTFIYGGKKDKAGRREEMA